MLAKILGWFFIGMGMLFILKPQILQNKLRRKSAKVLRKYLFLIAVFFGILLFKAGWGHPGFLPKIIMILGIVAIFKGVFLLKAKASDKILKWYAGRPLIFFRIGAIFYILIGILILTLR